MEQQEAIFREWLEQHKGLMYKLSRLYADGPEDREDLLQDMLYQVWVSIPSFKGSSQSSTWVYKVALNTALSWRRRESRHPRPHRMVTLVEMGEGTAVLGTDSPDAAQDRELLQMVYRCVCQLPKVDCALALLYLNGLKYGEMAEVLGMSPTNVGVRLNRIRGTLAEMMKGLNDGL